MALQNKCQPSIAYSLGNGENEDSVWFIVGKMIMRY